MELLLAIACHLLVLGWTNADARGGEILGGLQSNEVPCPEYSPSRISIPCLCSSDTSAPQGIHVNCDYKVFLGDFPLLPYRYRITGFSQRHVGYQDLSAQLFTASDLPLKKVDFSHNSLRRLTDRLFDGVEDTLEEIRLSHNLLGDQLNPIFSTNEFSNLKSLKVLDLGFNQIKDIEEGILAGSATLEEFHLEGNDLRKIPSKAFQGPDALHNLFLQENHLDLIPQEAFKHQPHLQVLNLSSNTIGLIQPQAFLGLEELRELWLSENHLQKIPGGAFSGLKNLQYLDLSNNFLGELPTDALADVGNLRHLILHSNRILVLDSSQMTSLSPRLQHLDLTRNQIEELPNKVFSRFESLQTILLGVNAIRKLEEESFRGLKSLSKLDLSDNNILTFPTSALKTMPNLRNLNLDYNRITALSLDALEPVNGLYSLSLAYNLLREIPRGIFARFSHLRELDLHGNQLKEVTQELLTGLEKTLVKLRLDGNRLDVMNKISIRVLRNLNLARNNITDIPEEIFTTLPSLKYLNLSGNRVERLHSLSFLNLSDLEVLDLSQNLLRDLEPGVFRSSKLMALDLHGNLLKEITTGIFSNHSDLQFLDLGHNDIYSMKPASFANLTKLMVLKLDHNNLASFKEETFADQTALEEIDLSHNQITYILSDSFLKHPKVKLIQLDHNRLNAFPGEIIRNIPNLEILDLSHNSLSTVDDLDFAGLSNLRTLHLNHNEIETVGETAFQNSSQIQQLNLGHNKIRELPENTFVGMGRLLLNLEHNSLSELHPRLLDRTKLFKLQQVNLAKNAFQKIPLQALQKQYFYLDDVDISHNQISDIPSNANIMVNIKKLDLSYNPLTKESIEHVLNEPKTVRDLNMAGTGVKNVPVLETPFLRKLNLSDNEIALLIDGLFQRPTLLQSLDVSHNKIPNLSFGLASVWPKLVDLREVIVSHNPISYIIKGDFAYLNNLDSLYLDNLPECTKIEKDAFLGLRKVKSLSLHDYPKIGYLDTKGILRNFRAPEEVQVEVKNSVVNDDLHTAFNPRLSKLVLVGRQIRSLSTGAFAGITSPEIDISITNTSLKTIPSAAFFPVPTSSKIQFDIGGNEMTSLSPQLLSTLEDRQRSITLKGLNKNPIFCDCNARPLQRWLLSKEAQGGLGKELRRVECAGPSSLAGKLLVSLPEDELSCDGRTTTTTTEVIFTTSRTTTSSEPDIIWSVPPTEAPSKAEKESKSKEKGAKMNNMDALIIGIVGGVVAFIAILIIIICIVRLRTTETQYQGGPLVGPLALRAQGKCTCLKPPITYPFYPTLAALPPALPPPPGSMGGTLPKMLPGPQVNGAQSIYGTLIRNGYYHNPPYYVTFPPESEGDHR